jgi:hypothetical protein
MNLKLKWQLIYCNKFVFLSRSFSCVNKYQRTPPCRPHLHTHKKKPPHTGGLYFV